MLDNTKNTSDLLSPELKKRIKYLVEHDAKEDSGWEVVQDEIFMCYYPALSEKEKLVCREILSTLWSVEFSDAPRDEVELRLASHTNFFDDKCDIENTINGLCAKGIVNWKILLNPIEDEAGNVLRIHRWETICLHPRKIQQIAIAAMYLSIIIDYELHNLDPNDKTYRRYVY